MAPHRTAGKIVHPFFHPKNLKMPAHMSQLPEMERLHVERVMKALKAQRAPSRAPSGRAPSAKRAVTQNLLSKEQIRKQERFHNAVLGLQLIKENYKQKTGKKLFSHPDLVTYRALMKLSRFNVLVDERHLALAERMLKAHTKK